MAADTTCPSFRPLRRGTVVEKMQVQVSGEDQEVPATVGVAGQQLYVLTVTSLILFQKLLLQRDAVEIHRDVPGQEVAKPARRRLEIPFLKASVDQNVGQALTAPKRSRGLRIQESAFRREMNS